MNQSERLTLLLPKRLSVGKIDYPTNLAQESAVRQTADVKLNEERKPGIIDLIVKTKDELLTIDDKSHSWPFICAYFLIEHFSDYQIDQAIRASDTGNLEAFAVWYDLAFSMQFVAASVVMAESEITGIAERGIDWNLELLGVSPEDNEQGILKAREFARQLAQSLIQDPRGFTTIAKATEVLDQLLEENGELPFDPVTCNVGARSAAAMYKAVYLLTDYITATE